MRRGCTDNHPPELIDDVVTIHRLTGEVVQFPLMRRRLFAILALFSLAMSLFSVFGMELQEYNLRHIAEATPAGTFRNIAQWNDQRRGQSV